MTTRSPIRDLALGDLLEAGDHPQRGRLAAAGRADEDHELAVVNVEVEVDEGARAVRVHLALAPAEDDVGQQARSLPRRGGASSARRAPGESSIALARFDRPAEAAPHETHGLDVARIDLGERLVARAAVRLPGDDDQRKSP